MSLAWPWALLALLAVPLVLGVAWWARRARRRSAVRVSSLRLVRAAVPPRRRWVRLIPAALLVAALAVLGVGTARPQATVPVASNASTILLALDVSGSMCATDIEPNRLTVAQEAAKEFVRSHEGARIGLVTFAGTAALLVEPTRDSDALVAAIDGIVTSRGTAIGQAILVAVDAIADLNPDVAPTGVDVSAPATAHVPEVIVVLTDGANSDGVAPQTAAGIAADRGVRVYTIGFGADGTSPWVCSPDQAGDSFGGFGGSGGRGGSGGPGRFDEAALTEVAEVTGGDYYAAADAQQLQDVLADLPSTITLATEEVDLAAWFAAAGGLLAASAVGTSLWLGRVRHPRGE